MAVGGYKQSGIDREGRARPRRIPPNDDGHLGDGHRIGNECYEYRERSDKPIARSERAIATELEDRMDRPVGEHSHADRSDWTEQDLLTRQEALPRLREAIAEIISEMEWVSDETARAALAVRLAAMRSAERRLEDSTAANGT